MSTFLLEKTNKGNHKIVYKNFNYRKERTLVSKDISWRCMKGGCLATLRTDSLISKIIKTNGSHSHASPVNTSHYPSPIGQSQILSGPQSVNINHSTPQITVENAKFSQSNSSWSSETSVLGEFFSTMPSNNNSTSRLITETDYVKITSELQKRNRELTEEIEKLRTMSQNKNLVHTSTQTDQCISDKSTLSTAPQAIETSVNVNRTTQTKSKYCCDGCIKLQSDIVDLNWNCLELKTKLKEKEVVTKNIKRNSSLPKHLNIVGENVVNSNNRGIVSIKKKKNSVKKDSTINSESCNKSFRKTKKIMIVSDSQGRGIAPYLQKIVGDNVDVKGLVYPGASTDFIINNIINSGEVASLSANDYIVILVGTNDIESKASKIDGPRTIADGIINKLSLLPNTNVVLGTIPYRYDLPEESRVNKCIKKANNLIRDFILRNRNVGLLDTYLLHRRHHTRHGLHINNTGKKLIAVKIKDLLSSSLSNCKDCPVNFLKQPFINSSTNSICDFDSLVTIDETFATDTTYTEMLITSNSDDYLDKYVLSNHPKERGVTKEMINSDNVSCEIKNTKLNEVFLDLKASNWIMK